MAEFYNKWDGKYSWLVTQPVITYRFKIELLDHWEQSHGEIIADVSEDEHFSININRQQGLRRTCSLTMIDINKKYIPNINNPFWYNKKFKLYVGVVDSNDTYWFSQGVFVCNSASAERHKVTINGVDKYGFLDGTLNTHMMFETYKIEIGSKVGRTIRELIMLELGNGMPIDPITPLIAGEFEDATTITEIVVDPGRYLGDILSELATMFGADIYYDVNGRLRVERIFNDDLPFYYVYRGAYWHFNDIYETYTAPSVSYEMDGCNYIMVATDNIEGEVYSYTAINDNPHSPVCVSKVGYRGNQDEAITYIPIGDTSITEDLEDKCRQHAEYMLLQKTCQTVAINFTAPMMPHLNVGEIIRITDSYFSYDETPFLIQSLTFNSYEPMSIAAVNIQWLPTDTEPNYG